MKNLVALSASLEALRWSLAVSFPINNSKRMYSGHGIFYFSPPPKKKCTRVNKYYRYRIMVPLITTSHKKDIDSATQTIPGLLPAGNR